MVATFTLHEGAPGHHMQITYRNDLDIPKFVRYSIGSKHGVPSMVQTNGAFKQGWGLYSEYLGYELGLWHFFKKILILGVFIISLFKRKLTTY